MPRPATGQKPIVTFRPPERLREQMRELMAATGQTQTEVLVEALSEWCERRQRRVRR